MATSRPTGNLLDTLERHSRDIRRLKARITGITGITDHGELDGLLDDDHTQYVLEDGTRAMSGSLEIGSPASNAALAIEGGGAIDPNGLLVETATLGGHTWIGYNDGDNYMTYEAEHNWRFYDGAYTTTGTLDSSGNLRVAGLYGWVGDTNTYMHRVAEDTIRFVTAGTEQLRIDSSGNVDFQNNIIFDTQEIRTGDGAANNPSFTFDSDGDTGIYRRSTNQLSITTGGVHRGLFYSGGLIVGTVTTGDPRIRGGGDYSWHGDTDTYMDRPGSNTIRWVTGGVERMRLSSVGTLSVAPTHASGRIALALNIERPWEFMQRGTGASTDLELRSTTNKGFYIGDSSNGVIASFHYGTVRAEGRSTTTNSGLAAWRNNGFPGDEFLALSSSIKNKRDPQDLDYAELAESFFSVRLATWNSDLEYDDPDRRYRGWIAEEVQPKLPDFAAAPDEDGYVSGVGDMSVPMAAALHYHEDRMQTLESKVAKLEAALEL